MYLFHFISPCFKALTYITFYSKQNIALIKLSAIDKYGRKCLHNVEVVVGLYTVFPP